MKLLEVLLVFLLILRTASSKPLRNLHRTKYLRCPEQFCQTQTTVESRGLSGPLASLQDELKPLRLHRPPALKVRPSRGPGGRGRCGLRQVQVRVSELRLGYRSQEELIFRYCSGPCLGFTTNYDRILTSLAGTHRSVLQGAPPTACCRPTEYERRLAFLDDSLLYHILKKHSAKRCGCV